MGADREKIIERILWNLEAAESLDFDEAEIKIDDIRTLLADLDAAERRVAALEAGLREAQERLSNAVAQPETLERAATVAIGEIDALLGQAKEGE